MGVEGLMGSALMGMVLGRKGMMGMMLLGMRWLMRGGVASSLGGIGLGMMLLSGGGLGRGRVMGGGVAVLDTEK